MLVIGTLLVDGKPHKWCMLWVFPFWGVATGLALTGWRPLGGGPAEVLGLRAAGGRCCRYVCFELFFGGGGLATDDREHMIVPYLLLGAAFKAG